MKLSKKILLLIIAFLLVLTCSCTKKEDKRNDGKLSVVTTLFPLYDFAKAVSGGNADITLLTQPGVDSHSFEPKSTDMIKISECDIFVYTGENMELWAQKLISSVKSEKTVVCDTSKGVKLDCSEMHISEEHSHTHNLDPHIWTSPKNAKIMVENICEAFCRADKKNESKYRKNAQEYIKNLEVLDKDFENTFSQINGKKMVFTSRFPFYYLARDYNADYISAFESCSAETEPDIKSMTVLIDYVKKENIDTVFYTELSDPKITQSVTSQTNAAALLFHSCHNVTKDEFERGEGYISLMQKNLKALERLK